MRRLTVLALLFATAASAQDLRIESTRHSLLGTYTRYQQYIDGLPVVDGERVAGPFGTHDALARRGFGRVESAIVSAHRGDLVYVNRDGAARLAIREMSDGPKRVATFFDASTGERLMERRLWFDVSGRVFVVNPVAGLNAPSLRDQNDSAAAVPDRAYSIVDLFGLAASGNLAGPNVQIVDTEAPFTSRAEASGSLLFDRSQPQFEEVNAYFHIDRSQRYIQSLGYTGPRRIVGYAIPVDAHAANGSDNSFYASGDVRGEGELYFGDGGTDDAEDSDIMLHEFAHAIHDWIAPGALNGTSGSEARALAEGFGDYWAFSQTYADTVMSGRDPACIGDWDARCFGDDSSERCGYREDADCLRRVDGRKTMRDFVRVDSSGLEHENGEIWSSALRDVFVSTADHRGVDVVVLESLFGAPANPTFAWQAKRMLEVDAALGGSFHDAICRAMTTRGILPLTDYTTPPRGERTLFESGASTIHVDDMRAIADVTVSVHVRGPANLTVVAPDGTSYQLATAFDGGATFGLDALPLSSFAPLAGRSAAGDWHLVVDGGVLQSWSLNIRFSGDVRFASRPVTTQLAKHFPVAGHLTGAGNTPFATDVTIFNRSALPASLLAVFTPTGADGRTVFSAVRLSVPAGNTIVLEDVVVNAFHTTGIGQLAISGDTDRIITNARVYSGGFSGYVSALNTSDAGVTELAPVRNTFAYRTNVGVAEVSGAPAAARFTFFDDRDSVVGTTDLAVAPFGHAQTRVPFAGDNMRATVTVKGSGRIIPYGSTAGNLSGDPYVFLNASAWWYVSSGPDSGAFGAALAPAFPLPQHFAGIPAGSAATVALRNFGAGAADATLLVYDAAGSEVRRTVVSVPGASIATIRLDPLATPGRIEVRGAVTGSVTTRNSVTNDLAYISGQY